MQANFSYAMKSVLFDAILIIGPALSAQNNGNEQKKNYFKNKIELKCFVSMRRECLTYLIVERIGRNIFGRHIATETVEISEKKMK